MEINQIILLQKHTNIASILTGLRRRAQGTEARWSRRQKKVLPELEVSAPERALLEKVKSTACASCFYAADKIVTLKLIRNRAFVQHDKVQI